MAGRSDNSTKTATAPWSDPVHAAVCAIRPVLSWQHEQTVITAGCSWVNITSHGDSLLRLRGRDDLAWLAGHLSAAINADWSIVPLESPVICLTAVEHEDFLLARLRFGIHFCLCTTPDLVELFTFIQLALRLPPTHSLDNNGATARFMLSEPDLFMLSGQSESSVPQAFFMTHSGAAELKNALLEAAASDNFAFKRVVTAFSGSVTVVPGNDTDWSAIRLNGGGEITMSRFDMVRLAAEIAIAAGEQC